MTEQPMPLREALRDAIEQALDDCFYAGIERRHDGMFVSRCQQGRDRVAALIAQIPLVFEARESSDE